MTETGKSEQEYQRLESSMVRYKELAAVEAVENGEPFAAINPLVIPSGYMTEMLDMENTFSGRILVRNSVYRKLQTAQNILRRRDPTLSLFVTYGYRSLEVQTQRFLQLFKDVELPYFKDPTDLYEEMHRYVAVPSVAGHPTGGAIDIKIKDTQKDDFLDFGSDQYDFTTKDCYVFSPFVTQRAKQNRMFLRDILLKTGFAPFDGEWWHFSYGDKEWAYYYGKSNAIYEQKSVDTISV